MVFSRRASGKCRLPRHCEQHVLGGDLGFGDALFGRAARAHVAGGEIEHAGAVARFGHADEGAAAGLLHVVGVGGDGQDVQVHTLASSFLRQFIDMALCT